MDCNFKQSTLDDKAKSVWDNYTNNEKRNVYATYTGIKLKDVDINGITYSMLPKYVKLALKDKVENMK